MARIKSLTNRVTGEIYDVSPVKTYSQKYRRWMVVNQDAFNIIANDPEITKEAYRVFVKLIAKCAWQGWVTINQTQLAKEMELTQPAIARAIKLLANKKIIFRDPNDSRRLRINDFYGTKGSIDISPMETA